MKLFAVLAIIALATTAFAVKLESQSTMDSTLRSGECACKANQPLFIGLSTHASKMTPIGSLNPEEYGNKAYNPNKLSFAFLSTGERKDNSLRMVEDLKEHHTGLANFLSLYSEGGAAADSVAKDDDLVYWEIDGTVYYKYIGVDRGETPGTGYFAWTTTTCTDTYQREDTTVQGKVEVHAQKNLVWYDSEDISSVEAEAKKYGYYVYDYSTNHSYFIPAAWTDASKVNWEPWKWVLESIKNDQSLTQEQLEATVWTYEQFKDEVVKRGYSYDEKEIQYVFTLLDESNENEIGINELVRQTIRIEYKEIADDVLGQCIAEDGSAVQENVIVTDYLKRNDLTQNVDADLSVQQVADQNNDQADTQFDTQADASDVAQDVAQSDVDF